MRKSTRQAKTAAKAKLSGAIQSSDVQKNKKIVFDDDVSDADDSQHDGEENENLEEESNDSDSESVQEDAGESDDDNVEEVTGSAARESTQKLRDAERKMAKDSTVPKKKRKKNVEVAKLTEPDEGSDNDDEVDELLTDDFLAMVDSERADQLQKAKQDKKKRKLQEKKRLGKHTTFVVDADYNLIDAPQKMSQNIEVVALGGVGTDTDAMFDDHSRQHLISATIGTAPSKAAVAFARGSLSSGTSMARGSSGKKRTSKKEETWKRSRKMNSLVARSRTGNAAALFVRKR